MGQLVCLQIHNDYQITGGETKTAQLIGNLLEKNGVRVIRYYRSNTEYAGAGAAAKIKSGLLSLYNPGTASDINQILDQNKVDFALVHNVVSVISNSAYKTLIKRKVPIIKYLQNYNLVCLNGALDCGEKCDQCQSNGMVGVRNGCYKGSRMYSFIKLLIKMDMDKNVVPHIKAFMPNSTFVMNEHVRRGIPEAKMHVMYNYVDIPRMDKGKGDHSRYVYFGRLSNEKGVMTLLKAFSRNRELLLTIMGAGPQEDEVVQFIRQNDLANVSFIGSKTGEELLKVVAGAKAVIVPSEWNEPLPRTILEAYSQGIPVIGSNKGGIPELINLGETGYVFKAGDVDSLYEAVSQIENLDNNSYEWMRANCLKRLEDEYTEKAYFLRFIKCVEEII